MAKVPKRQEKAEKIGHIMTYRQVVKLKQSGTKYIALPKKWCDFHGIAHGDTMMITGAKVLHLKKLVGSVVVEKSQDVPAFEGDDEG